MSFDREEKAPLASVQMFDLQSSASRQPEMRFQPSQPLHGERQLEYFIGSGKHGRTYLYQVAGTWFELPINYYTRRQAWGMAPAFDQATTMPADLPTDPNCLHCHATGVSVPLAGSRSHYPAAPFAQGGVGCSACHGDPSAHLAGNGHGPIVNPGHLDVARRDSACLSCHLEGDALVYRPGKSLAQFKAGDDLSETAVYFVRASREGGGGRAASQYEALLRSACKRAAGDQLTCTTCHDPHASPSPSERVAFYRAKCLTCHTGAAIATTHHPEQQDCAQCHMPSRATSDISHEQTVDHDIERVPAPQSSGASSSVSSQRTGDLLLPVGGWKTSDRELGMAYAQMAAHGDRQAGERALTLLIRADAAGASDAALRTQLGVLRQLSGQPERAQAEYLAALQQNPTDPSSLTNLAVLEASEGQAAEAATLLSRLVAADPAQTAAGLNLAFIECGLGQTEQARATLALLARYNPDDPALRSMTDSGTYRGGHCNVQAPRQDHARKER